MLTTPTVRIPITDVSLANEARRQASAWAVRLGFNETRAGKVALIVTEAAGNLLKHAGGGEVLLQTGHAPGEETLLEIIALDRGPGMLNVAECLRDGYSTTATPGTGLGAIQRLADHFEIHTLPGVGTALLARISARAPTPVAVRSALRFQVGGLNVPLSGESVSGDALAVYLEGGRPRLFVVDGLGHGPLAAEASEHALRIFRERVATSSTIEIVEACHHALKGTRGAALALCEFTPEDRVFHYAGVGNITGVLIPLSPNVAVRHMVSQNGTAGHVAPRIRTFLYPTPAPTVTVLHSDGIASGWKLEKYPGLLAKHPTLISAVLYRDCRRGKDDTSVLVMKEQA
jgi:anti-sigma regulatory factor (Ser/Thr protein kinase)